jgi:hypothetical protein
VREFEGMEQLEQQRSRLLGPGADHARGCIIPIVLRGGDEVPERITRNRHYANFSHFSLASPDIVRNPEYVAEIRKIADVIYDRYKTFNQVETDPCALCTAFTLPAASEIVAWRPQFVNR